MITRQLPELGMERSKFRDFTFGKYQELCHVLRERGYSPFTVRDYLEEKSSKNKRAVILRHDIDRKTLNALHMAELESALGISSTYYFRYPYTFDPEIIRRIRNMGHEIGYHYETLSKTKGNHEEAIRLFERELTAFREKAGCEIKTICMHGSPLSPHDNRDLWKHFDFREFGIAGEAYLSLEGEDIRYFTDTGRNWGGKYSVRDRLPGGEAIHVKTTDDLIAWITSVARDDLYLTIHPQRWARDWGEWALNYVRDAVTNIGKTVILAGGGTS